MKIFLLTPDKTNNISFYRGANPLKRLSEHYDVQFRADNTITLEDLPNYDVIMIQNPHLGIHITLIDECKKLGVKTWVDYDDLIYEASIWNYKAYKEFNNAQTSDIVCECIRSATFTTVSTEALLHEFKDLNENIYLVENAFDNELLTGEPPIGTENTVLYRGGESHNIDLWTYRQSILNAMKKSKWKMHFVGMNPIYLNQELNGTWTPQLSKPDYWNFLQNKCNAKICIVPLEDSKFNRAKSMIAWQEATYAGCAVLAPNWTEWQRDGILNYNDQVDFEGKLTAMMSGRVDLAKRVQDSRKYILNCLTLLKVNETRWGILSKHVNGKK